MCIYVHNLITQFSAADLELRNFIKAIANHLLVVVILQVSSVTCADICTYAKTCAVQTFKHLCVYATVDNDLGWLNNHKIS